MRSSRTRGDERPGLVIRQEGLPRSAIYRTPWVPIQEQRDSAVCNDSYWVNLRHTHLGAEWLERKPKWSDDLGPRSNEVHRLCIYLDITTTSPAKLVRSPATSCPTGDPDALRTFPARLRDLARMRCKRRQSPAMLGRVINQVPRRKSELQ